MVSAVSVDVTVAVKRYCYPLLLLPVSLAVTAVTDTCHVNRYCYRYCYRYVYRVTVGVADTVTVANTRYGYCWMLPIPLSLYNQNKVPKVDVKTMEPASWPANPSKEWCPPGHGDLYAALSGSGKLDEVSPRRWWRLWWRR